MVFLFVVLLENQCFFLFQRENRQFTLWGTDDYSLLKSGQKLVINTVFVSLFILVTKSCLQLKSLQSIVLFVVVISFNVQECGADAVALVPPRFFPPRSLDLLVQWVADVASAIPTLPVFYYHLDVINYTPYPINRFLELASTRIPNLCGMKFTDYNAFVMGLCLDACDGKFTVLMGREDVYLISQFNVQAMLASLATGCCGFVGSTFSIMGKVFDRLMNAYAKGDMKGARLEMERARNYSKIMYQGGNRYGEGVDSITLIKTCWEFLGIDNGPCRLLG